MKFKNIIKYSVAVYFFVGAFQILPGQEVEKEQKKKKLFDPNPAFYFVPNYTAQFPFGDMKDRFGFNSLFSMNLIYKTKTNWLVAVEGGFLYGTDVKQGYILNNIATPGGQFITLNNDLITVFPAEEGFDLKFEGGKIIPFSTRYPDAGIMLMTGVGFLEHKIAINVRTSDLPQLNSVYRKGYDRLTTGPVFSQFLGLEFAKRRSYLNGYVGIQFDIAYTEGRRPYDFYLMEPLHDKRVDMFLGLKVGWILAKFFEHMNKDKEIFIY